MERSHYFVYGVLVGIIAVLGVLLVVQPSQTAIAQTAGDAGGMAAVTGFGTTGQSGESWLWVLDTNGKRLAVYSCVQGKAVKPLGVRNITWDLLVPLEAEGRQLSDVAKVRSEAQEAIKRQEEDMKKGGGS